MSTTPDSGTPSNHPSDRPARTGGPDSDGPATSAPGTDFDAFLDAGRQRRTPPAAVPGVPIRHADPDPEAITRLPPTRRPAARFLARRGGRPKSLENLAWQIRNSCRLLQEAAEVPPADYRSPDEYAWHHVDRDHADRFRQLVHTRYSNVGTRNLYITVVREVLRECFRAELISAERFEELLAALPTKVALRTSRGRRLIADEVAALLRACLADVEPRRGARDAAVVAVFATTGVRCSDLVDLRLQDWDAENRSLYLVCTKNGHPHTVYLPARAVDFLEYWLHLRGAAAGPLFTQVIGAPLRAMTYDTVWPMLHTRADQAGVKRFGSHDFRRTVATTLLRTHDTGIVSRILGHRDVASTAVYDMAGPEECRDAVETLPMPPHPGAAPVPGDGEEDAA